MFNALHHGNLCTVLLPYCLSVSVQPVRLQLGQHLGGDRRQNSTQALTCHSCITGLLFRAPCRHRRRIPECCVGHAARHRVFVADADAS